MDNPCGYEHDSKKPTLHCMQTHCLMEYRLQSAIKTKAKRHPTSESFKIAKAKLSLHYSERQD